MIIGIGTDMVEMKRIREVLERHPRFYEKILTPLEVEQYADLPSYSGRKIEYLAGRFAAKEALSKAFGTGIGGEFGWQSASILASKSGAPQINWHKETEPNLRTHLSITHSRQVAMAFVILEK